MTTRLEDYLALEKMMTVKLQLELSDTVQQAWDKHEKAVSAGNLDEASHFAENLTLENVAPKIQSYAQAMMRAAIEYGASMAAGGGNTLTSSLPLDRTVNNTVLQLCQYLKYGASMQLQKRLLQLIARERTAQILKADPIRDFQSFKREADAMAQMVSGLHTSRLGGWGFTAEADMLGLTTYKLTAQLDNRTSKFCRFIHGKTFTVESAKRILDVAVYTDNPDDLKVLHPWPKQTNENMDALAGMSNQELQDKGFGVPPFHPYCRTLMVKVGHKTRISKPPTPPGIVTMPDFVATPDTFLNMGIKLPPRKVSTWNDYVGVDPLPLMAKITGKSIPEILTAQDPSLISVNTVGNIVMSWGLNKLLRMVLRTGTGELELSNELTSTMFSTGEWKTLKSLYSDMGVSSALAKVRQAEAYAMSEAGFVPEASGWAGVQANISAALQTIDTDSLTDAQLQGINQVIQSTSPSSIKNLHTLGLSESVLKQLLAKVAYSGVAYLDATGLS